MAHPFPTHLPPPALDLEASVALTEGGPNGDLTATISTQIVRLLRQHTGRGPTKAKTTFSGDLVVITLADCLTTADRQLADSGHTELVVQSRRALQQGMRADAIALIEQLTHREVTAYLSDQQLDPDQGVIVFMLAPTALRSA